HSTPEALGQPHKFNGPISGVTWHASIDAHPLLREYFDVQSRQRGVARIAHARLFKHLCASVPFWPVGRDGLLPLYQAVMHGCKAGLVRKALVDVYRNRILRSPEIYYSQTQLGLYSLDLGALACFFMPPWGHFITGLQGRHQGWLLNNAGACLTALNRLPEARESHRFSLALAE